MSLITKNEDIIVVSKNDLDYVLMDKKNFNLVYKIQKDTWIDDPDYDGLYDKVIHTTPINCMFLIYDATSLIGIVGIDFYTEYPNDIWLDWFTILPEYRQKGYGKKVLLDIIDYCKNLKDYDYFRIETTYFKDRPALFLYDKIMPFKENYTIEDTREIIHHTLIYSYSLHGKTMKKWNNRYLGLEEYYNKCRKNDL